jgi:hypothetical protein
MTFQSRSIGFKKTILRGLPANFPVPIVIAQHISVGFEQGMADWLNGRGFSKSDDMFKAICKYFTLRRV